MLAAQSARALIELARHSSAPFVQLRAIGGAIADIAPDATAFAHRDAELLVTATVFPPLGPSELETAFTPVRPHELGAYRNFDSAPSQSTIARAFPGSTGQRIRELARRYDPDGVLRNRVAAP